MKLAVRGAVLATPVVAMLVCAPWHLTRFSPPKVAVAFFGVLLGLVALGRPLRGPSRGRVPRAAAGGTARRMATWGWWGFCAWGAVSLVWSPDPSRGVSLWLLWLLAGLWALMLGRTLWSPERRRGSLRRHLAWTWLAAATLAAGLALAQRVGVARLGLNQVTSTLGNPNGVAVVLVLSLPLAVLLATRERGAAGRWLARALAVLLILAVLATGCRAALLALGLQAIFWCATTQTSRRFRVAAVALLLVAGALIWTLQPGVRGASRAATGRAFIARVSARVMMDHPVRGAGLGGFPARAAWAQGALLRERPALRDRWSHLEDAHNQVLMVGAQLGLVGLAALVLMLGPPLWLLFVRRRQGKSWPRHALAAWIGLGVCSLTETPLLSPVVVLLAFGWLALGVCPERAEAPVTGGVTTLPSGLALWRHRVRQHVAWPLVLVLAVAGLVLATSGLLAHFHLGQGLRSLDRSTVGGSRLTAAAECYDRGLIHVGPTSQLRFQRGLARRELGDHAGAEADMRHAFRLRPSPDGALFLGDLCLSRGDVDAAIPWYRRALRLHPRYQRAYNNLGVAMLRAGRRTEACRYLVRAHSLRPGDRSARDNVRTHCAPASPRRRRRHVQAAR